MTIPIPADNSDPVLALDQVSLYIKEGSRRIKIVDCISFEIRRGEFFALVGESGSGKTMIAKAVMRLLPDDLLDIDGRILVIGGDVARESEASLRRRRGAEMAMIFQEPMSSLNPLMRIGAQIAEAVAGHRNQNARATREQVLQLLAEVQFPDPLRVIDHYPHELSGGMRQRVMIAMALANRPRLLIADEPTTALDVTIEREIMELIAALARKYALAVLFISHDLSLVYRYAARIGVLYGGVLMENGPARRIIEAPAHPYSAALLSCLPRRREGGRRRTSIDGTVPATSDWPQGCRFAARCPRADEACRSGDIPMRALPGAEFLRCLHPLNAPPERGP